MELMDLQIFWVNYVVTIFLTLLHQKIVSFGFGLRLMKILKKKDLKQFMNLFQDRHLVINHDLIIRKKSFSYNLNFFFHLLVIVDETDCTIHKDGFEGWINSTEIYEEFPHKVENIMKLNLPLDCMFIVTVEEGWKV